MSWSWSSRCQLFNGKHAKINSFNSASLQLSRHGLFLTHLGQFMWFWITSGHPILRILYTSMSIYVVLNHTLTPNTHNSQRLSVNLRSSALGLDTQYSEFSTPLGQFTWFCIGNGHQILRILSTSRSVHVVLHYDWEFLTPLGQLTWFCIPNGHPILRITDTSR